MSTVQLVNKDLLIVGI